MKVIYFDQDCKDNFEEYAEIARFQKKADAISAGVDKVAIIACGIVSFVAIAILVFLAI